MENNDGFPTNITPKDAKGNTGAETKMAAKGQQSPEDDAMPAASPGHAGVNLIPMPPDGGYGWVIVFACFVSNAVVEGSVGSFGIFLPHFAEAFGASRAKTTIAGSLLIGGFLISGVVVSGLINCLGCRVVTMTGAVLTVLAFTLSTLAPNINVFIFLYGFVGGFGLAMIYLPAMVMVGYYFEKRRSLATGIAYSGAGIGMLVMAPVAESLVASYDWRNALILLAAFPIHGLVLGALMQPLKVTAPESGNCETTSESDITQNNDGGETAVCGKGWMLGADNEPLPIDQYLSKPGTGDNHKTQSMFLLSGKNGYLNLESKSKSLNPASQATLFTQSCVNLPSDQQTHGRSHTAYTSVRNKNCHPVPVQHENRRTHFISCEQLSQLPDEFFEQIDMRKLRAEISKPFARRDIFYSGSIQHLAEFRSQADIQSYIASITMIPCENMEKSACAPCPCISHSTLSTLMEMLQYSLLFHPHFVIICLASVFIQLGYFIPIVFISDYASSLGIPETEAALLISVIGLANTVGRASAGALGNVRGVNTLHLNNLSLIVSGVATLLVCGVCKTYALLVVYAAIFGLFMGAFVPLTTIFLVKYLGLDRLNNAVGLLSMVRGISSMAGPPIAGILLDTCRSHHPIFYFAGTMFVIAGFIFYLIPLHIRYLESEVTAPDEAENII